MTVTYNRGSANLEYQGKGWKAYRWSKSTDTLIIYHLWRLIVEKHDIEFSDLCKEIKKFYKNRTVKSSVEIYTEKNSLEIIRRGVFPNIRICTDDL